MEGRRHGRGWAHGSAIGPAAGVLTATGMESRHIIV